MHVHGGEQIHHISRFFNRNPVELDVLTRREVAIARGQLDTFAGQPSLSRDGFLENLFARLIVFAGDLRENAKLGRMQLAVGDRHTQHRRIALNVPAILQAQRAKFVFWEAAIEAAFQLIAVLRCSQFDEFFIEIIVGVHKGNLQMASSLMPA